MIEAKPICPTCGAPLFARSHGDMSCVSHGLFFSHDTLDASFGIGSAEYARQLAERSPQVGRKCPLDRYALSAVASPTGRVRADGCGRCGSLWIPWDTIDAVLRETPIDAPSHAEARSLMGLACARGVLTPAAKAPRAR
ncbi:MAG TPA: hypothetical protein VHH36_07380 [Candidatus Thermoplasmatota archaeon]|nr:hypothetical protein [Candidatus Thermoplasmatota archaeon]